MNLTRYLTYEEIPNRCNCERWILTTGNEFSDEKSAAEEINFLVEYEKTSLIAVYISVFRIGDGKALYYYVVTTP